MEKLQMLPSSVPLLENLCVYCSGAGKPVFVYGEPTFMRGNGANAIFFLKRSKMMN
jgi:hypothetical protein